MPKAKRTKEDEILSTLEGLTMAVGDGFEKVRGEFGKVHQELADVRSDIHRIEAYILKDHQNRLETVERKLGIR